MNLDVYRGEFTRRGSSPRRSRLGCAARADDSHETNKQRETGCGSCPHAKSHMSRMCRFVLVAGI
jgi:hypothetical protein